MRRVLTLAILFLVPAAVSAQDKDALPIKVIEMKRTEKVVFEKEIYPILKKKCITCHSGAVKDSKLDLSSYEGLVKGGKRGTSIVPGKKDTSLLYKLSGRTTKPHMPPPKEENQTPLSPDELALIGLWIDQGAFSSGIAIGRPEVVLSVPPAGVQPVRAIAISADKTMVAGSRGNQIHIYEGAKGEYVRSLFDDGLKVVDPKDPKATRPVKAAHVSLVESLAFSPDSKYLVSGSFMEVSIWDAKTGALKHKIPGFAHEVVSLAFTEDGKILATGGGSPTEDGEVKFFDTTSWKQIGEIKAGHSDAVYGLCFSPNEFEVVNDKKEKKKFGLMIATCSADKFIKVWEVPSGKFVKSFEGHTHHVLDVGWSADGKLLASAGGDMAVKVWDFEKGEQVRSILNAHGKQVTRLLFIGKKIEAMTGGGDGIAKIYNIGSGGVQKTFTGGTDFIYAIGASPDGAIVAAGGQEGVVRLYNGLTGALIRVLLPPDAQPPMKTEEKKK